MEETTAIRWFRRIQRIPFHNALIVFGLKLAAPYSANIRPRILKAEPCSMEIAMKKRRAVTNHMRTVHAVAMANLVELTASACVQMSIPRSARWIPSGLNIRYLKKARSDLRAVCRFDPPDWQTKQDIEIPVDVFDTEGDKVVAATLLMRIGPKL
ncbi:MAG: hotdog fold domain-containing protein [Pseudomonadota bacterium]|nr:hotdog fold domain-containing protein [Pseudomonadota bacterium]